MPVNIKLPENGTKDHVSDNKNDKLIKYVTFFGDSAIPEESPYYESTWQAARLLATHGYGIVNGGGPGIMKAATDGAESVDGDTIAVYWQPKLASYFEGKNLANVTDESETASNYIIRTLGLIEKGDAYVVCKGGTGTVSEFGMVWALAKLYYGCHKPVILYGEFWDEIIESFRKNMYIDEVELGVLYRATTPQELLDLLVEHEQKIQHCKYKQVQGDETAFILGADSNITKEYYENNSSEYHSKYAGKLVAQEQLDEFISMVNPPAKVLDLGTGPGLDANYLATKYTVTGLEISKKFAGIAKFENPGMEIINDDFVHYDLGENIYKGIWARDSIHHVKEDHMDKVFVKIAKALVSGGIFYAIVREGVGEFVETEVRNYKKSEKFYHLFTKEELIQRASRAGFEIVRVDITQRSHTWLIGVFRKI
jgi:predicted Rossmann-fold nucleotide-binding protein/SAM-dependent methyltransferase